MLIISILENCTFYSFWLILRKKVEMLLLAVAKLNIGFVADQCSLWLEVSTFVIYKVYS